MRVAGTAGGGVVTAYVPILVTDAGRLGGLAAAPDAAKARLTPLLDVTPPRGRPLEVHLDALVEAIAGAFGARPALVDARDAGSERGDDCARTADGRVHLAYLLDAARARGLALVPVTGLRRPDAYQLAVADAAQIDRRGVALRLQRPDFRDPATLHARARAVLDVLTIEPEAVDLVLDFGGVTAGHLAAYEATARAVLAALTCDVAWRSVTIAAATQLLALGRGPERGPRAVPRTDWLLWRALTAGADAVPPLAAYARAGALRFGDYGPLLYGPYPVRADRAAEWVGYAHGAEWIVSDVVGDAHRADGPRHEARSRDGARHDVAVRADGCWGDARRPARGRRASSAAAHAEVIGGAAVWPEPPPDAWPTSNGAASDLRRSAAERATWRAAAVTHHLTVAVEQLAPLLRVVDGD
ncbi:hypothetical protein tb265_14730 [Gemmatimonadetes bacterium T265]|nr:hypothetical protein tb265_14730 [Gemmatimonadetes bacterium T265]